MGIIPLLELEVSPESKLSNLLIFKPKSVSFPLNMGQNCLLGTIYLILLLVVASIVRKIAVKS